MKADSSIHPFPPCSRNAAPRHFSPASYYSDQVHRTIKEVDSYDERDRVGYIVTLRFRPSALCCAKRSTRHNGIVAIYARYHIVQYGIRSPKAEA